MARTPLFRVFRRALVCESAASAMNTCLNRREFLRLSGRTLVAAAALRYLPANAAPVKSVAIIGGGAAGLTAAYRLTTAGVIPELFEASPRLGGRMFTLPNFYEGLFCELGGELIDTHHDDIRTLTDELGLTLESLRGAGESGEDLYFFGGQFYRARDLLDPATGRGAFVPIARRVAADNARLRDTDGSWTDHARRLDALSLESYLSQFRDMAESWVVDLLRIAYQGEYGLPVGEQSALNLVDLIGTDTTRDFRLFGDSDEAFRIKGGSSALIEALVARLRGLCPLHLGCTLEAVAQHSDGRFALSMAEGLKKRVLTFDAVILTLPFTRLRAINGIDSLGFRPGKLTAIRKLGYGNNAKLMSGTKTRAWRSDEASLPALSNGSFLTDLPFQSIWETSRVQPGKAGVLTNFLSGGAALRSQTALCMAMADGLHALSPAIAASLDRDATALFQWHKHPYTLGSYASARPGQYTHMLDIAGQAECGGRLQFAGEHTSREFLGYMNGAVQSGNRAAQALLARGAL